MPNSESPDPDPPLITTDNSLQYNPLQIDLQLHKDATNARFEDMQESMKFIKNQQAQLRAELPDEFKQMRLGSKTVAGFDISLPLRIDFIPSSSLTLRPMPATSVTGNLHSLGFETNLNFVHPTIHPPSTSIVSDIGTSDFELFRVFNLFSAYYFWFFS